VVQVYNIMSLIFPGCCRLHNAAAETQSLLSPLLPHCPLCGHRTCAAEGVSATVGAPPAQTGQPGVTEGLRRIRSAEDPVAALGRAGSSPTKAMRTSTDAARSTANF
jgi:hypothetical protein